MTNTIRFDKVSKRFKEFSLNQLSFSVKKGFVTGFIGPNGAGKTSTIKLMMDLIHADSGLIELFGLDIQTHGKEIKERIGFVYAESHFYEHLNLEQNKRIISLFYKNWDDALFYETIQQFELPKKRKLKHFSTGMKMKFSLAVALAHRPDLIIMDEPTSGLDPVSRSEILDILSSIMLDEEKTIFFSTHITSDLEKIADYITFVFDGQILFNETKDCLLEKYAIVKGNKEWLDQDTRKDLIGVRETEFGFEALTSDYKKIEQCFGEDVLIEKADLEQIMVYMVREKKLNVI